MNSMKVVEYNSNSRQAIVVSGRHFFSDLIIYVVFAVDFVKQVV